MQIRVGFEMAYRCPQPTPMLLVLNIHHSRASDLVRPDLLVTIRRCHSPRTAICSATGAAASSHPPGRFVLSTDAVVNDSGAARYRRCLGARRRRSSTCPSRPWSTCSAAATARPTSCPTSPGSASAPDRPAGPACRRSAISCTSTSSSATSTRGAHDRLGGLQGRRGRLPRLRPPGDHVLPLPEHPGALLHRLPRRHRHAAAVRHDGLRRLVRGLPRRPLVHLRCAQQHAAHRPRADGPRPRRLRRGAVDHLRAEHARAASWCGPTRSSPAPPSPRRRRSPRAVRPRRGRPGTPSAHSSAGSQRAEVGGGAVGRLRGSAAAAASGSAALRTAS